MTIIIQGGAAGRKARHQPGALVIDGAQPANRFEVYVSRMEAAGVVVARVMKQTGGQGAWDEIARFSPQVGLVDYVLAAQEGADLLVILLARQGDDLAYSQLEILHDVCVPRGSGGGNARRPLPVVPPGQQTFVDVAPTDTFWREIETLYMMGAIGGYDNQTFRPNNPLTRGQMCKVIVNALRYIGG